MSQTTLTSFFNSRKRPATDDIISSKSKVAHIDHVQIKGLRKGLNTQITDKNCISSQNSGRGESTLDSIKKSETKLKSCEVEIPNGSIAAFSKKTSNINQQEQVQSPSDFVKSARKELSLGDIKKRLAGSSRLAELKANADRISKGIQQLKDSSEKKNLKEFKSIKVDVPTSPSKKAVIQNLLLSPKKTSVLNIEKSIISPRKVFVSPIKSPNKVPAYIRHAALATATTSLPLPHQYRSLAELFRSMETVVALLYNRGEKITFAKLKPSVQEMLKKNFTERHLSQIKHIVPDFYNFEIQKLKNFATSSQKESYQLIISPNFPIDIKIMNPSVLLERRRYFYDTLLQLTKKHHAQYLLTLDPPMVISDEKLTRWHPEFELEKVPEVECAKLPEAPNAEKFSSAQDVLAKARELFKCNTKMERALEKLAKSKATEQEQKSDDANIDKNHNKQNGTISQNSQPSTSAITILNPALRNLPTSLLEKVKAKQAAKALEAMTRSAEYDQKYLVYSRLPDLARTLRNIFVTERKNVLALNVILSKLDSSFKSHISSSDLQKDIKVLTEEASDWIKMHSVRNTSYLKLDKNADLKTITSHLEALANKYKND